LRVGTGYRLANRLTARRRSVPCFVAGSLSRTDPASGPALQGVGPLAFELPMQPPFSL